MANSEVAAPRAAAAGGDHILQVEHATHRFGEVVRRSTKWIAGFQISEP